MFILPVDKYDLLKEKIKEVKINNLFARSVIEKHVAGKIYVDDMINPETIYVIHPYGISLLFGNHNNDVFNDRFKAYALNSGKGRVNYEWMQAYPNDWDRVMHDLFGKALVKCAENTDNQTKGMIEMHTRVNFRFNKDAFLKRNQRMLSDGVKILETNKLHFEQMPGSVIPLKFWNSASEFLQKGKGYTLFHKGDIASTAYTAFVHEDNFEIGIETVDKFRGHGFAERTCSKLIDYCIEKDYIPVWSCRLENTPSFKLAQKLGFEPTRMIPFYRLSN